MAFTVTARHSGNSGQTSAQTFATDSVTPTASSLLLAFAGKVTDAHPNPSSWQTPTGGSLTYTQVDVSADFAFEVVSTSYQISTCCWRAPVGASPSAHTVTVDAFSGSNLAFYHAMTCDITGHNTTTPVVQSKDGGAELTPAGDSYSGSVTLDATPTTGNLVVVCFSVGGDTAGAITAPTIGGQSMTQLFSQSDTWAHGALFYRVITGTESNNTITTSDLGQTVGHYSVIAVEIASATAGPVTGAVTSSFGGTFNASGETPAPPFPVIPTAVAGRVLTVNQANTTATRTFPSLTGLTKNNGDLLIAIIVAYQTSTGTDAAFSGWTGGFTEFHDSATSTTLAIGCAYKWSDGTETGTIAVTQAGTITGHASMILLSISAAHATIPPEAGGRVSTTNATQADSGSFNPSGWDVENVLWIAVGGDGETSLTGSYTAIASGPANYTDLVETGISADAVGGTEAAVAFRQLNAASEDIGAWTADTSNARHAALTIAVVGTPQIIPPIEGVVTSSFGGTLAAAGTRTTFGVVTSSFGFTSSVQGNVPVVFNYVQGISANGRYFVDQNDDPILVKGDSPWAILLNANQTEMDLYIETRAAQGFNAVLCSLLGAVANGAPNDNGEQYDGTLPFVGGDMTNLNDTYWDRVEYFITKCHDFGITVLAYPIDGWVGTTVYGNGLAAGWTQTQCQDYGEAVAARLTAHDNIIWAVGGDYSTVAGTDADNRQYGVLQGLATGGMDRITSIQFSPDLTSLDSTFWDDKVDWNFVYSYVVSYDTVEYGYGQSLPGGAKLPALFSEGHYEAYSGITDLYLRAMAAWALTSGSPGEFYGSEFIWDDVPTTPTLETTAVDQLSALRAAFEGLTGWHQLVPDYSSTFVTAGRGTKDTSGSEYFSGNTYTTAARTPDGTLAVVYHPAATTRQITINEALLGSGYTATWVDPTNGATVVASTGSTYQKTGANDAGGSDWLLVFESANSLQVTGVVTSSFGGTLSTAGIARTFGVVTTTFGGTLTAAGIDRVLGVVTSSFGGTFTANGVILATEGQVTTSFGGTFAAAGISRTLGQVSTSFGGTFLAQGVDRVVGLATSSFGFTSNATGVDRVVGQVSTSFGFASTAAGTVTVVGVVTSSFGGTFSASGTTAGTEIGQVVSSFGGTFVAVGVVRKIGQVASNFGGSFLGVGNTREYGTVVTTFGFVSTAGGLRRVTGVVVTSFGGTLTASGNTGVTSMSYIAIGGVFTAFTPQRANSGVWTDITQEVLRI